MQVHNIFAIFHMKGYIMTNKSYNIKAINVLSTIHKLWVVLASYMENQRSGCKTHCTVRLPN